MGRRGRKRQLAVEDAYWQLIMAGVGTGEACQRVGITRKTGYRWRAERGGLPPLRVVEEERGPRYLSLLECQRIATLRRTGLGGRAIAHELGPMPPTRLGGRWSDVPQGRRYPLNALSGSSGLGIVPVRRVNAAVGYQPDDDLDWCRRSVDHHRKGLTGGEW
jgi:hypothetical protein